MSFPSLQRCYLIYSNCILQIFILLIIIPCALSGGTPCSVSNCLACVAGDAYKCATCNSGFNQTGQTCCVFTERNCSLCSITTSACTYCVDSSFCLISTNKCSPCESHLDQCATCSTCTTCLTCNSNLYGINSTTAKCQLCSQLLLNCLTCNSQNICAGCAQNIYIVNATTNKCALCSSFITDCLNCTSPTDCTNCANTTLVFDNVTSKCLGCSQFISNCLKCSSTKVCTECISTQYTLNSTYECVLCKTFMEFCTNCTNSTICISCSNSPEIVLSNKKCAYCSAILPNCLKCRDVDYCIKCGQYYALNYTSTSSTCALCRDHMFGCSKCTFSTVCTRCSYGRIVTNGCSTVPGCISVIQRQSYGYCTRCDISEFHVQAINGQCKCMLGHLAGQYCTEIVGCTNIMRRARGDVCTVCNTNYHFLLQNNTCICESYFELNGQQCTQICGDGILILFACDDGNTIYGDGCSSACKIQQGYRCSTIDALSSSYCIFYGYINISVVCIYKLEQPNQAEIILAMNPYIQNIQKYNYSHYFTFASDKNSSLVTLKIANKQIILTLNYYQDIQESNAQVSFQYNHDYIISPKSQRKIQFIECNGDKLLFDPKLSKSNRQSVSMSVKIFSALVIIIFLVGSYFHKMIGVEALHTFQLIFIMQVFAKRYIPVVAYFNDMGNTLDLYENSITNEPAATFTAQYNRLNLSSSFINNLAVVGSAQLIALIIYFVCRYVNQCKWRYSQQDDQFSQKIPQRHNFIYNFLIFPFFIGFYLTFFLSLVLHLKESKKTVSHYLIKSLIILCVTFVTIAIISSQWKQILCLNIGKQKLSYKKNYISLHLTYLIILSFIIYLSIAQLMSKPLFVMGAVVLIYTIFIIRYRPYESLIHQVGLIINQLGIILSMSWLISQDFIYQMRPKQELFAFVLVGWLGLILIWTILRIIFQIRKGCKSQILMKKKPPILSQPFQQYQKQIVNLILKNNTSNILNNYQPSNIEQQLPTFKRTKKSFIKKYQITDEQREYQENDDRIPSRIVKHRLLNDFQHYM